MGLRMDNIHMPTVEAGPTTRQMPTTAATGAEPSLPDLISEKDRVESELMALGSVLESHGVNMNTPLTTFDGYPRDDLDIAQIRTTRARIIHLRNDYKSLMSRIESGLHAHHASMKDTAAAAHAANPTQPATASSSSSTSASQASLLEAPFAKVNSVVSGSPADEAGLKAGDAVRRFGSVNIFNNEKLAKVAETVQRNEGRSILVKVRRDTHSGAPEELQLQLMPRRNWGGRGMLGCHLVGV